MSQTQLGAKDETYPEGLRKAEGSAITARWNASGTSRSGTSPTETWTELGTSIDYRTGVALSGGGIRSATFCLGVFQALAERGLIREIDFVSTVSGGGYFGSFLGRLFTREWIAEPCANQAPPGETESLATFQSRSKGPDRVEAVLKDNSSWCMRWLRDSGRYLSPNGAGDTILATSVFLRNWISLLLLLFMLAVGALTALTGIRALLWDWEQLQWMERILAEASSRHLWWSSWIVVPLLPIIAWVLPSALAYWQTQLTWTRLPWPLCLLWERAAYIVLPAVVIIAVAQFLHGCDTWTSASTTMWLVVLATTGVVVWLSVVVFCAPSVRPGILCLWRGFRWFLLQLPPKPRLELLDTYTLRNRLSRWLSSGAIVTVVLAGVALIDTLGQSAYALAAEGVSTAPILKALAAASGLVGIVAFARRLTLLLQKLPKTRVFQVPMQLVAGLAAGLLALLLLVSAAAAAHAIAWRGAAPVLVFVSGDRLQPGQLLASQLLPSKNAVALSSEGYVTVLAAGGDGRMSTEAVAGTRQRPDSVALLVAALITVVLSLLLGQMLGFINLSSLHALYTARLTRAYLGASNPERWKDGSTGLSVGDPIEGDDLNWANYAPWEHGGPLHLVNVTLNETVSGKSQIEYRDRKGLAMVIGPAGLSVGRHHHAIWKQVQARGSSRTEERWVGIEPIGAKEGEFHALGVNGSGSPNTECERVRLGKWIGISGAAFSTGVGSRTSLGTSLLAGLLNVRLGYWWSINISPSQRRQHGGLADAKPLAWLERGMAFLFPVQTHLLQECLARFHGPILRRWYLSDGGHFENTGVYELIRRRVPFIVACDCGCDPDYEFADIANLVRKARVDFGAEIKFLDAGEIKAANVPSASENLIGTFEDFRPSPASVKAGKPDKPRKHALLAKVKYDKDPSGPCSYILFIKPGVTGDEAADVLHYQQEKPAFPNESTADQYFDEAQWESYRQLGFHIAGRLFRNHDFDKWKGAASALFTSRP